MSLNNIAVLILSCHKYSRFWEPFFTLFKKYWFDCPFKIYLGTDVGNYKNINTIQLGHDFNWATNCKKILNIIPEQFVILFLEDYLLIEKTNTVKINELLSHMIKYDIGCLRLNPCPGPTGDWPYMSDMGLISKNDEYRMSLQPAAWNKKTLNNILKDGESAWETEINGTKRSNKETKLFISVNRGVGHFPYIQGARMGKITKSAFNYLKKENIKI